MPGIYTYASIDLRRSPPKQSEKVRKRGKERAYILAFLVHHDDLRSERLQRVVRG
jgi:hypothetical protein